MFDTYEDALEWIHTRKGTTPKPGIRRMEWMMEKLGHPERKFRSIHIAGTNGKGSTVAYLTSLFQATGNTVGSFTSPHIMSFNERISINGHPITDEEVLSLVQKISPLYEEISKTEWGGLTEFEVVTCMMFLYFSLAQPDVVLLEVGLGGLFDSTNVVQPNLSIITTIGLDHIKILGNTMEDIAFQKAGIIKPTIPVVIGNVEEEAKEVLLQVANENKSEVKLFGRDFHVNNSCSGKNYHEYFDYSEQDRTISHLEIGLIGQHQIENAATSLQAFLTFASLINSSYTDEQIREGLLNAFWPVRLEIISQDPFIILDGAHNEPAMEVLLAAMQGHFPGKK
ncbi:bifunctional folylpolyglutamate synthase/dihydrofolate synthase [Jeotgalibaca sp. MA1X17-3]|uniref:bifunctional folylpolyglutamate synthase/dihydrofolate synthase n=1 Tax=Jeotgalibaca sp. MA1X17-3 TaxID=2908211 RepID=UPI001F2652AC|nr:folylpolyglutamate synthase/dihydrofolate synthase family protein [Jeotgalibaca sp. MA1X17-3]UJF15103.1 bifunctional folylpolyglutamate synthase/dihydrofolate synthase [Jeotgalibaca sp. MA1X17-3]